MTALPPLAGAPPWAPLEAGLDTAFKAFGARLVLVALVALTWVIPEATRGELLFAGVRFALDLAALAVTLWLAAGLLPARRAPLPAAARALHRALLAAAALGAALELSLLLDPLAPLWPTPDAAALARLADHALLLVALALALALALAAAPAAAAAPLRRPLRLGLLALAALLATTLALYATGLLAASADARAALVLLTAAAAALALSPLHRLARRLAPPAPAPARPDLDLHAPWAAVVAAERLPNRTRPGLAPDADDPWVPRRAPGPGLPHRASWVRARDGLRLAFGGLALRVSTALIALVVPLSSLGGGALAALVGVVLSLALATGDLVFAWGLWRAAHVPASSGARALWLAAAALAAATAGLDLAALVTHASGLAAGPPTLWLTALPLGTAALAVLAPLLAVLGVRRLAAATATPALRPLSRRPLALLPLFVALLAGREVLDRLEGREAQGVLMVLALALGVAAVALLAQVLRLLHEGAEAIDDHLARADRLPPEPGA